MAIWQFPIFLLPTEWAVINNFNASLLFDDEYVDTRVAWYNNPLNSKFKEILSDLLPQAKSWHNELLCWGNPEENDIQVWFEDNSISSIQIRLDLRQNVTAIIEAIINAAKILDCALFFPEQNIIIEANVKDISNALQKSKAARFLIDPKDFLNNLEK